MARPLKELNWDVIERMMAHGSSALEICGKFHIQTDTFYRRFKQKYKCGFQDYKARTHEGGKGDLRSMLWAKTLNNKAPGNPTLLLFMARCVLGMKEPDATNVMAPKQTEIDHAHTIMQQAHRITELEEKYEPKTE